MPHSISPAESPASIDEDSTLPDAPPANLDKAEADNKDHLSGSNIVVQGPSKENVKLEDLFDDDEEDEEFPSSSMSNGA
ncbi:MAG: hypothetical protein Q9224_007352, partial [Gallowayella concinna]